MSIVDNLILTSIEKQNALDLDGYKRVNDRTDRLTWDSEYREQYKLKSMFAQARRRAAEKPVSLPKIAWLDKNKD
jgi:hypothetical protein